MNDPTIFTAFIGATTSLVVALVTTLFAWLQWRRDVQIKLAEIRDEVTTELIRQRVKPYNEFVQKLEPMSSVHREEVEANPKIANEFEKIFQEALYGPVGMLASHDTRQFIVYARLSCTAFAKNYINYEDWRSSVWSVLLALRSDLGIVQPDWDNEIDRLSKKNIIASSQHIVTPKRLVEAEQLREMIHNLDRMDKWD